MTDKPNTKASTERDRKPAKRAARIAGRSAQKLEHLQAKFDKLHVAMLSIADMTVVPLDHPAADLAPVEIAIDPEATTTVLAVAGMAMRVGMAPREFHGALSSQKCNLVFIKDFKQAWYQHGLLGQTSNIDETAEFLKTVIPPQTKTLRVVGSSAGGFGAIHLGVRLRADKVLAFGPQTMIGPKVFEEFQSLDSDSSVFDFLARNNDLRNLFKDHPEYKGEVKIVYGDANKLDSKHAKRMAKNSQVKLHPLEGYAEHNTAGYLRETGALQSFLDDLVAN